MAEYVASLASTQTHELAEGPAWDSVRGVVLWVDILGPSVFEGRLNGDLIEAIGRHDFEESVTAVVPSHDGQLLVASGNRLVVISPSGVRSRGPAIGPLGIDGRTNDGACDPAGRFLVGTKDSGSSNCNEVLFRVEDDGSLTTIDSHLTLSNGLAWSPDGSRLYVADTIAGIVWARDYNAASGLVGERERIVTVDRGYPDGLCVDTDGNLWVAVWGAGEVRCYTPNGVHLHTVAVRAPHTSSVAFVGERLDLLLITTAREGLSEQELETYPDSGRLFSARVGVTGAPVTPWSGAWLAATPFQ